jgi:hypothetical protein
MTLILFWPPKTYRVPFTPQMSPPPEETRSIVRSATEALPSAQRGPPKLGLPSCVTKSEKRGVRIRLTQNGAATCLLRVLYARIAVCPRRRVSCSAVIPSSPPETSMWLGRH